MSIEKVPFRKYDTTQEEPEIQTLSMRLNKEEQANLKEIKIFFQEEKDSTAIKLLIQLGLNVIHEEKIKTLREILLNKKKNNERLGIVEVEK
jgi:hypothetical protein